MGNQLNALLKNHAEKIRFAVVGGLNTGLDFGLLFISVWLGVPKIAANYISTTVAFIFSFFMNRSYTFKSSGDAKKQIIPFLAVTAIGLWLFQPLIIWLISEYFLFINSDITLFIAKLIATIVTLIWNYIMYAKFVFKK